MIMTAGYLGIRNVYVNDLTDQERKSAKEI